MGNEVGGSKKGSVKHKTVATLNSKDVDQLATQTGMAKYEIEALFHEFRLKNPTGLLNKKQFIEFYAKLNKSVGYSEAAATLMFDTFDSDASGHISFDEFLVRPPRDIVHK